MDTIRSHRELIVWQKAMDLAVLIYELTDTFPNVERYGLVSQMRRAAVSIPSNIAEGRRRSTKRDYAQFLTVAFGSASELETQLEIVHRVNFGQAFKLTSIQSLLIEVMKMLNKMLTSLKNQF